MAIKYLYLDDDPQKIVGQIARALSIQDALEVEYQPVEQFTSQVEQLIAKANDYDGLLLDLRLDQEPGSNGQRAEYTATTLAQFLRTKVYDKEAGIKDFPIILCSQQSKIGMYNADLSSHDLFDYKFPKEDVETRATQISNIMISLVRGYRQISESEGDWNKLLGYDAKKIDKRMFSRFASRPSTPAAHDYARYIIREILTPTNELIKEPILAARLGQTIKSVSWPQLRDEIFGPAKYQGVFSESWQRWWQPEVNRIFENLCGATITSLNAEERVGALTVSTNITGLTVAEPIEFNHSTWYWTICEAYQTPLDPTEGFRLLPGHEPLSWQDYDYISLKALLERLHETDLERPLHPEEQERFDIIQEDYI